MTTLRAYYDMLMAHDWFFDMSDDRIVRQYGRDSLKRLREIAKLSPEHEKLFNTVKEAIFVGKGSTLVRPE